MSTWINIPVNGQQNLVKEIVTSMSFPDANGIHKKFETEEDRENCNFNPWFLEIQAVVDDDALYDEVTRQMALKGVQRESVHTWFFSGTGANKRIAVHKPSV
jgi:hypothetical protein